MVDGSTITEQTTIPLSLVFSLIALVIGGATWVLSLQAKLHALRQELRGRLRNIEYALNVLASNQGNKINLPEFGDSDGGGQ